MTQLLARGGRDAVCTSCAPRSMWARTSSCNGPATRRRPRFYENRQAGVLDVLRGAVFSGPVADLSERHARGDGGYRDLQHAVVPCAARAQELHQGAVVQRCSCVERAGPQDGHSGRGVAGAPTRVRAAGRQLHPGGEYQGDPDVIRYHKKITESRISEIQRLCNVLQDAGIYINSIASSVSTVSGRSWSSAHLRGTPRRSAGGPGVVCMRRKISDLSMSLVDRFGPSCPDVSSDLDHIDQR